jgi:hypothetical protein
LFYFKVRGQRYLAEPCDHYPYFHPSWEHAFLCICSAFNNYPCIPLNVVSMVSSSCCLDWSLCVCFYSIMLVFTRCKARILHKKEHMLMHLLEGALNVKFGIYMHQTIIFRGVLNTLEEKLMFATCFMQLCMLYAIKKCCMQLYFICI